MSELPIKLEITAEDLADHCREAKLVALDGVYQLIQARINDENSDFYEDDDLVQQFLEIVVAAEGRVHQDLHIVTRMPL